MTSVRAAIAGVCVAALAGCASVAPVRVDVAGKAAEFRARSIGDAELTAFARRARGDAFSWPPAVLGVRDLDLIAIYDAPAIATARARWAAARAAIRTARAIPNPKLTLDPAYVAGGGAAPPFFLAGTLIQLIETANKRPLRVARAEYSAESARLQTTTAAWTAIARVDGAAIDYAAARARGAALDEQAMVQGQVVETATKRLAVGLGSSIELTVARTALTRATLDRQAALAAEVDALHRLAEAVGLPQAALPMDRLALGLDVAPLPESFLLSARDAAPLRRADVLSGVADYAASVIEARLQNAARVPNLDIGPSVEYDQGTKRWGVSVGAALPIFNRNAGPIAEAEAQRRVAAGQLLETQATAIGEIDRGVAAYRQAVQALAVADRLVTGLSRQLAAQRRLLQAGQVGRADVLTAQGDLALAKLGRTDALANLARARLAIEIAAQATSDGFDPAALLIELDAK
jgi:outer membrane protein, heavy metal efflux system